MEKDKQLVIGKLYDDILSPSLKQIGFTLEQYIELVLKPLNIGPVILNKRIDKWLERVTNDIPKEKRVIAQTNILLPTLNNMMVNLDESVLGEMFFNILESSMDLDKQQFLSPSFPRLLGDLTRDEAIILLLLSERSYVYNTTMDLSQDHTKFINSRVTRNDFPINKLTYPTNFLLYIDHLANLNLANCLKYKEDEPIFSDFSNEIGSGAFSCKQPEQIGIKTFSEFKLTRFGEQFSKVCITDKCKDFI